MTCLLFDDGLTETLPERVPRALQPAGEPPAPIVAPDVSRLEPPWSHVAGSDRILVGDGHRPVTDETTESRSP
jgi:hypothetical protein